MENQETAIEQREGEITKWSKITYESALSLLKQITALEKDLLPVVKELPKIEERTAEDESIIPEIAQRFRNIDLMIGEAKTRIAYIRESLEI